MHSRFLLGFNYRLSSTYSCYAKLVTGTRRRDHITPVLRQLHWLPVRQRVDFKLALLPAPGLQVAARCNCTISCRRLPACLRSADIDTCCVPRTNTRLSYRSFAAAGPRLWNSLPARIRQPDNDIGEFRRQLKSFLFN